MKSYAHHDRKDFILCLGYKGEVIKDYFRNYHWNTNDVTLHLGRTPWSRASWSHRWQDSGPNTVTYLDARPLRDWRSRNAHFCSNLEFFGGAASDDGRIASYPRVTQSVSAYRGLPTENVVSFTSAEWKHHPDCGHGTNEILS